MRIPIWKTELDTGELERIATEILTLPGDLRSKLEAIERAAITATMRACGHNKSEAARVLGMDRKALERRWHRFNDPKEADPSNPSGHTTSTTTTNNPG
ncbi:MAG TPA: helix-turn-helix domain-containing protein [Polyangiaceae bacterium]|nr:helix-turn-helix domain-containing protein [Polyangiaceae bacterium]